MIHIGPVELLDQWLYSCSQERCKLCLGLCFFTISLQFWLLTGQGLVSVSLFSLFCRGWWENSITPEGHWFGSLVLPLYMQKQDPPLKRCWWKVPNCPHGSDDVVTNRQQLLMETQSSAFLLPMHSLLSTNGVLQHQGSESFRRECLVPNLNTNSETEKTPSPWNTV